MTTEQQIREMTYEQLRDWWAEDNGWLRDDAPSITGNWKWKKTCRTGDIDRREYHPLPDTLDAVAACLGDGWGLVINRYYSHGIRWFGDVVCVFGTSPLVRAKCEDNDEKALRLRLACLARLAERGSK